MRIIGYCERCHRVKQVIVRVPWLIGGVPVGVCDECREAPR